MVSVDRMATTARSLSTVKPKYERRGGAADGHLLSLRGPWSFECRDGSIIH